MISIALILVLFLFVCGTARAGTDEQDPFSAIAGFAFSFCSGAGAWETVITFAPDGSFSGNFHD